MTTAAKKKVKRRAAPENLPRLQKKAVPYRSLHEVRSAYGTRTAAARKKKIKRAAVQTETAFRLVKARAQKTRRGDVVEEMVHEKKTAARKLERRKKRKAVNTRLIPAKGNEDERRTKEKDVEEDVIEVEVKAEKSGLLWMNLVLWESRERTKLRTMYQIT